MTNRVVLSEGVEVRSANGPLVTSIVGQPAPGTTNNGDGAIRCVYVGKNAVLSGFTLTNGHTRADSGADDAELSGGGAWCESGGVLTNCTLTANSASWDGGGASASTLNNCNGDGIPRFDMGAYEFDPGVLLRLSVALRPSGLRLEWPATALGAKLQRTSSLTNPAWQNVPGSETAITVTLPLGDLMEFFRLVRP